MAPSSLTILAIMVMGGLTIPEEELEEDQALHEHPEVAEAVATLCWDSRAASMKIFLTLVVAISVICEDNLLRNVWAYKISVDAETGSIWILAAVSAFSGMSVLTVSGVPAALSYMSYI